MAEIIVKKTSELLLSEKQGLIQLFNVIFNKSRTIDEFDNQFISNALGYSYHVFLVDHNEIVGSISHIPSYYLINNKKYIFVIGVDAMIHKKYRDFFYYYDMLMALNKFAENDGAVLLYNFPNDISNPIVLKAKLSYTIGRLNTYILPYRISGIKSNLKIFNILSITFSFLWVYIMNFFSDKKASEYLIKKDSETFNQSRYKRMDRKYNIVNYNNVWFVYKIMNYEGVKTAFLIDVEPKSSYNFNTALKHIIKKHSSEFDIILYIGKLNFKSSGLIKVPQKFEPKVFNFAAYIFDETKVNKEEIFNINNWDVNLSDTDLI